MTRSARMLTTLALAAGAAAAPAARPAGTPARGVLQVAAAPRPRQEVRMSLQLSSTSFRDHGEIPRRHTCDAEDLSPPLAWAGAPAGTRSLALIVDDPDAPDPAAPQMTWVHWVLYNLPAAATSLPEGATAKTLPSGALEGLNDWKRPGWRGPCPPVGRHRYVHKLYALDALLPDLRRPTKAQLEKAMEGHVLARTALVGTYARR